MSLDFRLEVSREEVLNLLGASENNKTLHY